MKQTQACTPLDLFNANTFFVEVILPLPIPKLFSYRVPLEISPMAQVGARVIVPFGRRKVLTGIIAEVKQTPPTGYEAKYIIDILDNAPLLSPIQLRFYEWMAEYYLCTLGEVIHIALPSGFKVNSESYIALNPDCPEHKTDVYEDLVIDYLTKHEMAKYETLETLFAKGQFAKILHRLMTAEQVLLLQKTDEKYTPKTETRVRLAHDLPALNELITTLANKPKQANVLKNFKSLIANNTGSASVSKSQLTSLLPSDSPLNTLIKNGILESYQVRVSRIKSDIDKETTKTVALSQQQTEVYNTINNAFTDRKPVLLHGVTGSGKTEVYFKLIQETLLSGKQALLLLPEIALSTQMIKRVAEYFGKDFGIYHSRFSDNERVEIWRGVEQHEIKLIVGVRSSIFLPYQDLGLIIVDEEHDTSYKQNDPAPRYNARDAVHILAQLHQAHVVLGSATPSYESYHQTEIGKWALASLNERFEAAQLPQIEILSNQYQYVEGNFKNELYKSLAETLAKEDQAILFKNRRGYSPYIKCLTCDEIVLCPNCNVSLTYHQYSNECRCHYCSYSIHIPQHCSACGSKELETIGQGTEKIEDEVKSHFPDIHLERMDYDTTRKKNSFQRIIDNFSSGQTQVLVGTQMVTKGLDFSKVTLVGVYDADFQLNFPDFRAKERSYQMLTQVAGRAGRKGQASKVLIHSNTPQAPFFNYVIQSDYEGLYREEIEERKLFLYPPFTRMVKVVVKNELRDQALRTAQHLYSLLTEKISPRLVLGPQEPLINKIRNLFVVELQIKLLKNEKLKETKAYIYTCKQATEQTNLHKKSIITLNVDP